MVRWAGLSTGVSYNLDTVGQGPTALAVGAGGGCLDIFTLIYPFSPLSPFLRETARYRLEYCLKGPLNPKQPTNQPTTNFKTAVAFQFSGAMVYPLNKGCHTCIRWHTMHVQ